MAYDDILVCTKGCEPQYKKGKHYTAYIYLDKISLTNEFGVIIEHINDNWFKEHFTSIRKHRENQLNKLTEHLEYERYIDLYKGLRRRIQEK